MKTKSTIIIMLLVSMLLASCNKKNDKNKPVEPKKEVGGDNNKTDLKPYIFIRNSVSSVDLGESIELIGEFRLFNIAVNSGSLTNLSGAKKRLNDNILPQCCGLLDPKDATTYKDLLKSLMSKLDELASGSASERHAAKGIAGFIDVDNNTKRILDSNGEQIGQVLQKSLMGALQLDKINTYLGKAVDKSKDLDNIVSGQNYTMREHYWDVAYGFVGRNDIDKKRYSPLFLANYIEKETVGMPGLDNLSVIIYQAFYNGREAATKGDVSEMVKQKEIIQSYLNKMMKLRTIFYLNESSTIITKTNQQVESNYFNSMGEALGFVLALPFVNNENGTPFISVDNAIKLYNSLLSGEDGVWDTQRLSGVGEGSIYSVVKEISRL